MNIKNRVFINSLKILSIIVIIYFFTSSFSLAIPETTEEKLDELSSEIELLRREVQQIKDMIEALQIEIDVSKALSLMRKELSKPGRPIADEIVNRVYEKWVDSLPNEALKYITEKSKPAIKKALSNLINSKIGFLIWHGERWEVIGDRKYLVAMKTYLPIFELFVPGLGYIRIAEASVIVSGDVDVRSAEITNLAIETVQIKGADLIPEIKNKCIIATATYGSELSPEVQFLRYFRDNIVLSTFAGKQFMQLFNAFYYSFSPTVANYIIDRPLLRTIIKIVLYPLIGILHFSAIIYSLFNFCAEAGVILAGLISSSLIGVIYFSPFLIALFVIANRIQKTSFDQSKVKLFLVPLVSSIGFLFIGEIFHSSILVKLSSGALTISTLTFTAMMISAEVVRRLT